MSSRKVWVHIDRLPVLFYRLVVLASVIEDPSSIHVHNECERIEFLCALYLSNRFIEPPHRCKLECVPLTGRGIVWVKLDGPLEFTLGAHPVPIEIIFEHCQRCVS